MAWSEAFSVLSAVLKNWAMNRKYIVWKYFIILLAVTTLLWDSDECCYVSFYFPTYLQWAHCYFILIEKVNSHFKRRTEVTLLYLCRILFACLIRGASLRNTHPQSLQSWRQSIFPKQPRVSTWHRLARLPCSLWPWHYHDSDRWLRTPAPLASLQNSDLYSQLSAGDPHYAWVWQKQEMNMAANTTDSLTHSLNYCEDICYLSRKL